MKKKVFYLGLLLILIASWFLLKEDVYYSIARQDLTSMLQEDFTLQKMLIIEKRLDGPVKSSNIDYKIFTWTLLLSTGDTASLSIWVHKSPLKLEFYSPRVIGNSGWVYFIENSNAELKE